MLGVAILSFTTGFIYVALPVLFAIFATLRTTAHLNSVGEFQTHALLAFSLSNLVVSATLTLPVIIEHSKWFLIPSAGAFLASWVAIYIRSRLRQFFKTKGAWPTLVNPGWFIAPRSLFVAFAMLLSFPTIGAAILYVRHPRAEKHPVLAFLISYVLYFLIIPIPLLFVACYRNIRQANVKIASMAERKLEELERHRADLISEETYLKARQLMTPIEGGAL